MLSIFSPEISSLESQVDALQAQIVQAQERINQLGECEAQAGSAVQMLSCAVTRIAGLAPSAVAALKASVLNLFNSGNDSNDGGQPVGNGGPLPLTPAHTPVMYANSRTSTPAPGAAVSEPSADSNREKHAIGQVVVLPEQLFASAVMEVSDAVSADGTENGHEQLFASDKPELAGQHSPLLCQVVDAPLMGQFSELACLMTSNVEAIYEDKASKQQPTIKEQAVSVAPNKSVFKLVELTPCVAYMKRVDSGEILCCYLGGSNKSTLKAWGEWLCITHSVGTKFELRAAQRLTQFKHEIKVWGMSLTQIQRLGESDTLKRPPSNFGTAPKREAQRVPSDLEISDYKPGDVVRSATVRNWSYTILAVTSDGLLEVERIGINPPIKSTLSPASEEYSSQGWRGGSRLAGGG